MMTLGVLFCILCIIVPLSYGSREHPSDYCYEYCRPQKTTCSITCRRNHLFNKFRFLDCSRGCKSSFLNCCGKCNENLQRKISFWQNRVQKKPIHAKEMGTQNNSVNKGPNNAINIEQIIHASSTQEITNQGIAKEPTNITDMKVPTSKIIVRKPSIDVNPPSNNTNAKVPTNNTILKEPTNKVEPPTNNTNVRDPPTNNSTKTPSQHVQSWTTTKAQMMQNQPNPHRKACFIVCTAERYTCQRECQLTPYDFGCMPECDVDYYDCKRDCHIKTRVHGYHYG